MNGGGPCGDRLFSWQQVLGSKAVGAPEPCVQGGGSGVEFDKGEIGEVDVEGSLGVAAQPMGAEFGMLRAVAGDEPRIRLHHEAGMGEGVTLGAGIAEQDGAGGVGVQGGGMGGQGGDQGEGGTGWGQAKGDAADAGGVRGGVENGEGSVVRPAEQGGGKGAGGIITGQVGIVRGHGGLSAGNAAGDTESICAGAAGGARGGGPVCRDGRGPGEGASPVAFLGQVNFLRFTGKQRKRSINLQKNQ